MSMTYTMSMTAMMLRQLCRYSSILTCRRTLLFLLLSWVLVLSSSAPPLFRICPPTPRLLPGHPACLPQYTASIVYPLIHVFVGIVVPLALMLMWNMHIVTIAKYHQFRIANAIFKMTFSHLNMSANERRRQEQNTALKRFQVSADFLAKSEREWELEFKVSN